MKVIDEQQFTNTIICHQLGTRYVPIQLKGVIQLYTLQGSWVAMPTPFSSSNQVDFGALKVLIDRQIQFGTTALFILGSAGETTLLTIEEKKSIIANVIRITSGRIPTFFNCSALTTDDSVDLARFCEAEAADGIVFTVPPYVLISQEAVFTHLDTCIGATTLPCGIYNNPKRLGVNVDPETISRLVQKHPNFVVDKEAVPSVKQLTETMRIAGHQLTLMCCDYPEYSIVIPTLALGGSGTANISGNVIPEEVAKFSRPWTDIGIVEECRAEFFKWVPLMRELYALSNPIVIKAALNILGLPGGAMRRPYLDYDGAGRARLETMMIEMGVMEKYAVGT